MPENSPLRLRSVICPGRLASRHVDRSVDPTGVVRLAGNWPRRRTTGCRRRRHLGPSVRCTGASGPPLAAPATSLASARSTHRGRSRAIGQRPADQRLEHVVGGRRVPHQVSAARGHRRPPAAGRRPGLGPRARAATAAVAAQNLQVESGIGSKTVAQWVWSIKEAAAGPGVRRQRVCRSRGGR